MRDRWSSTKVKWRVDQSTGEHGGHMQMGNKKVHSRKYKNSTSELYEENRVAELQATRFRG